LHSVHVMWPNHELYRGLLHTASTAASDGLLAVVFAAVARTPLHRFIVDSL